MVGGGTPWGALSALHALALATLMFLVCIAISEAGGKEVAKVKAERDC